MELSPITHNQKRRAAWHDYAKPGTYLLTLVIEGRRPLFGQLEYELAPEAQATVDGARETVVGGSAAAIKASVALSPLGEAIVKKEIKKISQIYPQTSVWKYCMMPDHLHIILRISAPLPKGKHLGTIVNGFKYGCTIAYRRLLEQKKRLAPEARGTVGGTDVLFEPGYNDRIMLEDDQLDSWTHYIDDNPRRLALKHLHPTLFTIRHNHQIGQWACHIIGNIFLLNIPDKMPVIVHRADTDEVFAQKKALWLACGERGGVLVSAAIAKREIEVINEAKSRHYRVITLHENGFSPFYKPSGRDFDACADGILLQISPWEFHNQQHTILRSQCLSRNRLAEEIERMKKQAESK